MKEVSKRQDEKRVGACVPGAFSVLLFAVFIGFTVLVRFFAKDLLSNQMEYQLAAEHVHVSEAPPWVPADFVDSVLRHSGLTSASLLEKELPEKLAKAFAADPWVESVARVELRFPSGAEVALAYRRPVAVVEVAQDLLPIDSNGVLLRTDYFIHVAPEKKNDYLRVVGIRSTPLGGVGTVWADPLVLASAQIATILEDISHSIGLTTILPAVEKTPTGTQTIFRLQTAAGTEFLWGRFSTDDPNNDIRKQRLLEFAQFYGTLDNVPPSHRSILR